MLQLILNALILVTINRQLIRICRRLAVFPNESLHDAVHKVSLSRFLPSIAKDALNQLLAANGIAPKPKSYKAREVNSRMSSFCVESNGSFGTLA